MRPHSQLPELDKVGECDSLEIPFVSSSRTHTKTEWFPDNPLLSGFGYRMNIKQNHLSYSGNWHVGWSISAITNNTHTKGQCYYKLHHAKWLFNIAANSEDTNQSVSPWNPARVFDLLWSILCVNIKRSDQTVYAQSGLSLCCSHMHQLLFRVIYPTVTGDVEMFPKKKRKQMSFYY